MVNNEKKSLEKYYNNGQVFLKINSAFGHLGKAEKQVATFIKNYPEEITKLPINILAEKVGVSVSTIIRLCRRIGINGYTDLKMALTRDLVLSYKKNYADLNYENNIEALLEKTAGLFTSTIENTIRILSNSVLLEAVRLIIEAETVLIVGTGGTAAVAQLLNHKFLKLGIKSQCLSDFNTVPIVINNMNENDILFAISHSGSTSSIYESVAMAAEKNIKPITLTNYLRSPVAKKSSLVLTTAVSEDPVGSEGGTTRLAQVSVIEILCLLLALKKQDLQKK